MRGEVEQILLFVAGRRELLEVGLVDDHVAGGAGHYAFAGTFERLAGCPGDVEQPRQTVEGRRRYENRCSAAER